MKSPVASIFDSPDIDPEKLRKVEALAEPKTKYIIAMTPRSGSSHLCDVMKNSGVLGNPGEFLPVEFIPKILKRAPARNADDYLKNVLKVTQGRNGVAGVKTSWFQFKQFCSALEHRTATKRFSYIYLTRRDTAAQAVSLYKATESSYFHTNVQHSDEVINRNRMLDYDFQKIDKWHAHISAQEAGWQHFFAANHIFPLCITYEDIDRDVDAVTKRIADYLGLSVAAQMKEPQSIFRKIGDRTNVEWGCRYVLEKDNETRRLAEVNAQPVS